jgi:hypothetical protein
VAWLLLGCQLLRRAADKRERRKGLGPDSARRERDGFFFYTLFSIFCFLVFKTFAQFEFTQEFKTTL